MKKKTLATALALTCALSLAACGETGSSVPAPEVSVSTSVSEETKTSVSEETPASTETSESTAASGENNESSEPIFSEPGEGELNINGVWRNDKNLSNWIVIQNLGQGWSLYDELGEELFYGNIELNGDNFNLIDQNGDTYATIAIMDADCIMDTMFQETYTRVESLPDKFPGQLVADYGFGALEGDWIYQQSTRDNTADYKNVAYVSVDHSGSYKITWLEDLREATGVIIMGEESDPDGNKVLTYSFLEGGNNFWITAITSDNPEVFIIDQEGLERLVINVGEGD